MPPPLLTIAIPTYDRPHQILQRVEELLPRLSEETELVIIDNHSPSPVEDLIRSTFDLNGFPVRFVRNRFNIGAGGNVCRCFEEASAKWMWMLGDDDVTDPAAIENILLEIRLNKENQLIAGFTCSSGIYDYPESKLIASFKTICDELSDPAKLCNSLFISAHVYRLDMVQHHLRGAYLSLSSYAPHLVIMLKSIESGYHWKYLSFKTVHHTPPNSSATWNPDIISAGLPLLLESVDRVDEISAAFQNSLVHHLHNISFKRSIKKIAFSDSRSLKRIEIYYFRVAPLMCGLEFFKMILLASLARLLFRLPGIHRQLSRLAYATANQKTAPIYDDGRH